MSSIAGTPSALRLAAEELRTQGFDFFLVSRSTMLAQLDHCPLGVPVAPLAFLQPDSYPWSTADFLRLFNTMNALAFRTRGLPMAQWVMVDHGLLSSAFMIVACSSEALAELTEDESLTESQRALIAD